MNFGGISKWNRWLVIRRPANEHNSQNGIGFGSLGDSNSDLEPCTGGRFLQQSYLSKDRKRWEQPQQTTEESPQCESSWQCWKWNPLDARPKHTSFGAGAINPQPNCPGIHWDLDLRDGLTLFWWKTSIPPPISSQGTTGKDLVENNR